ncbi:hypothetical protein GCM10010415_72880 [Streptomyces atrovirens]
MLFSQVSALGAARARRIAKVGRVVAPWKCDGSGVAGPQPAGHGRRILGAMTKSAAPKRHLPTSPFKAPVTPPAKEFAVGDQVTHDMYGLGRVVGIEEGIAAVVNFGSEERRILSPYSKMTKL